MKPILTLILVLTFGATALANTQSHDKVDVIEMGLVLDTGAYRLNTATETKTGTETSVARLYRRENTRVLKALSFTTKRNKAKMA
ncbi:hypothetical protein FK220_000520 [Flavobacteriaceae bacterium TP-CH-4]|uniref:Uncharacterized protein n=1 Tax=Pelagihabitans pacificus TaxID=2696054 RepID=A0A967AP74_9FLAO|nr:hypothetical protein [Pelagihabitans pacificus]NHF57803.1 hypothetical protein [Pelagihabitans pacificus]